jgi:hypothetical protein
MRQHAFPGIGYVVPNVGGEAHFGIVSLDKPLCGEKHPMLPRYPMELDVAVRISELEISHLWTNHLAMESNKDACRVWRGLEPSAIVLMFHLLDAGQISSTVSPLELTLS